MLRHRTLFQFICIAWFSLVSIRANTQEIWTEIDSLKAVVNSDAADTSKIRSLNFLGHYYSSMDSVWAPDSALYFLETSKELMKSSNNQDFHSFAYFKSFLIYDKLQNSEKAVEQLLEYLDVAEKHEKYNWQVDALSELMLLFDYLGDTIRSEEYALELISIMPKVESKKYQADAYNSLGTHYKDRLELDKALEFHQKSLAIRIETGNERNASFSYNNIGLVYKKKGDYEEALKYYFKSLEIKEKLNNTKGMAGSNINISKVYSLMGKNDQAIPFVTKGIQLAKEAKALNFERNGYLALYDIEKIRGNSKAALAALEKKIEIDEIIHNSEVEKQARELERRYEADKRLQEVRMLQKDQEISDLELSRQKEDLAAQRNVIIFFIIGSVLVLILIVFLVINRNQKARMNAELKDRNVEIQLQKEEAELQKNIIEEKNKEITDSIGYAKKIQSAILPSKQRIESLLDNHFILYKPKDIVAGDFYWVEEVNGKIYVAAADCTGHGVPGAMVSVVCANILNTVLYDEKVTQPSKILDRTRDLVVEYFERSDEMVKDGMDIAMIAIEKGADNKFKSIEFSGAHNPLILIPKDATLEEIKEIKGTKQPIGKHLNPVPFENHKIDLNEGDQIYLFTDGFQDQFGGEHKGGKKLKSKNFLKLLHTYHQFDMIDQPTKLDEAFHKWAGDLEQVDDVCVIGIRI